MLKAVDLPPSPRHMPKISRIGLVNLMEHTVSWTDERIDQLKRMWEKGMTASQIADELGGVSRNAVIGKAHRLGLQSRPSP
jgi:hypothetical protein